MEINNQNKKHLKDSDLMTYKNQTAVSISYLIYIIFNRNGRQEIIKEIKNKGEIKL